MRNRCLENSLAGNSPTQPPLFMRLEGLSPWDRNPCSICLSPPSPYHHTLVPHRLLLHLSRFIQAPCHVDSRLVRSFFFSQNKWMLGALTTHNPLPLRSSQAGEGDGEISGPFQEGRVCLRTGVSTEHHRNMQGLWALPWGSGDCWNVSGHLSCVSKMLFNWRQIEITLKVLAGFKRVIYLFIQCNTLVKSNISEDRLPELQTHIGHSSPH